MSEIVIGKNTTTNADVKLVFPTVAVVTGKKMAGKTFLIRKIIERKEDGRIILITNKPDSYHGYGDEFQQVTKENAFIKIKDHLTIIDAASLYENDPEHILDNEIRDFTDKICENDLIILDEAYPYLRDETNKYELLKGIEESWKKGASVIVSTNQVQTLIDEAPQLLEMCEYSICMMQDKDTAVKFCELAGSDRAKYEMLQVFNLMEFGSALVCRQDGVIQFIKVC